MQVEDQVRRFQEFIEKDCKSQLAERIRKGKTTLEVDYSLIPKFDPKLAELILDNPENLIKAFELAVEQFDFVEKVDKFRIRIKNLPESQRRDIWEIRKEIDLFIKISGYIIKVSEILTLPSSIIYECPQCAHLITILRTEEEQFSKLSIPERCPCGKKGKMRLKKRNLTNFQKLILEEDTNEVTSKKIPRRKMVLLMDDLTDKEIDKKIKIGSKVTINGFLKLKYMNKKENDEMDTFLLANSIEFDDIGWDTVYCKLTKKEKEELKELSKSKGIVKRMSRAMIPDIHKNDDTKKAIFLFLCGAKNIYDDKGFLKQRGTIHIGLVGSPSAGKTYMAKRVLRFAPISRFTSAATSTGRGLIATVLQDKEIGGYAIEAGVVATCNHGLIVVDELDKLNKDDYGHFNNFMNDLKVTVDKATIHATLETDTALLATLNPSGRVFRQGVSLSDQILLPKDLLDRFDLMIPTYTLKLEADQREIIKINIAKRKEERKAYQEFSDETILNYISYARSIEVEFPDELDKFIEDSIIKFTRPSNDSEQEISHRIYEVVMRFIEASARAHLRNKITREDILNAISLKRHEMKELGLIDSKGFVDYELVEGISEKKGDEVINLKRLFSSNQDRLFSFEELLEETKIEEEELKVLLEKLKRVGDIFEPKYDKYKSMG